MGTIHTFFLDTTIAGIGIASNISILIPNIENHNNRGCDISP